MNICHSEPENIGRIAYSCICCGSAYLRKSPAILMPFVAFRAFGWEPVEIDASWGLKTINSGTAYSICNSIFCSNCELLFLDIRFSDMEVKSLYSGYRNKLYVDTREKYEPGYKIRNDDLNEGITHIDQIESFLSNYVSIPMRLLDWGGDTGKNTPFKRRNINFHIFDISKIEPQFGAKSVSKSEMLENTYDLIICSHVLEHVPYPVSLIQEMKNAMYDQTILYIEVPLEEIVRLSDNSNQLHLRKKHWHEHINFFSEKSLLTMMNLCGFIVLEIKKINIGKGNSEVFVFQIACKLES